MADCEKCGRSFVHSHALEQHYVQSRAHSYCQRCSREFADGDELLRHRLREHHYCYLCKKVHLFTTLCIMLIVNLTRRSVVVSQNFVRTQRAQPPSARRSPLQVPSVRCGVPCEEQRGRASALQRTRSPKPILCLSLWPPLRIQVQHHRAPDGG